MLHPLQLGSIMLRSQNARRCPCRITFHVSGIRALEVRFVNVVQRLGPGSRAPSLGEPESLVAEDLVHIFQAAARRLGIEEPRDGHEGSVEHGPDDVQLVTQVFDRTRCHIDDDEVGNPMSRDTEGDAFVASAQGHDLGGVHPGDREDAKREEVEKEEAKCHEDPLGC